MTIIIAELCKELKIKGKVCWVYKGEDSESVLPKCE